MVLNFVIGTAAELIKLYPVIRLAEEQGLATQLFATGQSRENLSMQLQDFGWSQERLTWLVASEGDLDTSGAALRWFARAWWKVGHTPLANEGPVIVHGDTLSTLIGARWGRRQGRSVAHIEAGLRSRRLFNPFPEEITRRLVSRWAQIHFAPDQTAKDHLSNAGVGGRVVCTNGNSLMDAVRLAPRPQNPVARPAGRYGLVNIHRYENLNHAQRWQQIIDALLLAARRGPLLMVLHPQTRHRLAVDTSAKQRLLKAGVEMRERMRFTEFMDLLKGAEFLLSDGGSNQEECSYLGKPCLLLRMESERSEGLDGCCVLSHFDRSMIEEFLMDPAKFKRPPQMDLSRPSEIVLEYLVRAR